MKFLILGAGPAGLTVANRLIDKGVTDFCILEREDIAGGLCRSVEVDGAPFDIGGGHFLDVRRPLVTDYIFKFLPINEWNKFVRDSRILINNQLIGHPIEANIWQLSLLDQVEYLKSIASAGCNTGSVIPTKFVDWIFWKLGKRIAEDYMIPYNQKVFGSELNRLGTYWLEKLPNVSFEETLLSCLTRRPYGTQPGHANFYYPKSYGYGEVWLRMANRLGDKIRYGSKVNGIDFINKLIYTTDGKLYKADTIITTIPWKEFSFLIGMPVELVNSIKELKYSSIQTEYFSNNINTKCHWIYDPQPSVAYHRILLRHNFCPKSRGYWTETNKTRVVQSANSSFTYLNEYAYPLNTIDKPKIMKTLLEWSKSHGVLPLGRWGEHQHYNSDLTVELAMNLADTLEV